MVCLGYCVFFYQACSTHQHGTEPWFSEEHGVLFRGVALMLFPLAFYVLVEQHLLINRRIKY